MPGSTVSSTPPDAEALAFAGEVTVASGAGWSLHRSSRVLRVRLWGQIDDATSDTWRAAAGAHLAAQGYPAFGFVDTRAVQQVASLQARLRSAAFLRACAEHMQEVVLVQSDAQVHFVLRVILRVAARSNVRLVTPSEARTAALRFDAALMSA